MSCMKDDEAIFFRKTMKMFSWVFLCLSLLPLLFAGLAIYNFHNYNPHAPFREGDFSAVMTNNGILFAVFTTCSIVFAWLARRRR